MTAFFDEKLKEANWPSGGVHFDLRIVSKISLSKALELSSLSWKKSFQLNAAKEFFDVLLD